MNTLLRWVRVTLALGAAVALTMGARAAGKDVPWLKISTPEFVLITSLKEKEAKAWASEFSQYIAALRVMFTNSTGALPPLTIVVFDREAGFAKYRPLTADGRSQEVAGFFLRHQSWSVAGMGGTDFSDELRRTIFHEGVHWFLSAAERTNPVWFEEGLAEVFSTFTATKGSADWGKPIPEHVALLRYHGLMPMEKMLFTGRDELFGKDLTHTTIVYAQSWAFAHFLIFGKHDIPIKAINDYATLSDSGVGKDEAFSRAFGKSYKEMDRLMKDYVGGGSYFVRHRELAKFEPPTVAIASRVEVEDALGRLALGATRWGQAAIHARAAIAAAPEDPRGHEVLGLALKGSGDTKGATAEFTRAVELQTKDPIAYFELACEEQNDSGTGEFGQASTIDGAAARRVANRYERAINLFPRFREAYANLGAVAAVVEPIRDEDRKFLELGHSLWPTDGMISVGLAVLAHRDGKTKEAAEQLKRVLASTSAEDAPAKDYARRLQEGWDQQDIITALEQLIDAKKYSEANAMIETHLEKGVAAVLRVQLVSMQGPLQGAMVWQKIEDKLDRQEWTEARKLIGELLASEGPAAIRAQGQQVLAELDRRRLGLEAKRK